MRFPFRQTPDVPAISQEHRAVFSLKRAMAIYGSRLQTMRHALPRHLVMVALAQIGPVVHQLLVFTRLQSQVGQLAGHRQSDLSILVSTIKPLTMITLIITT
jgi:hypothetical protein